MSSSPPKVCPFQELANLTDEVGLGGHPEPGGEIDRKASLKQ